MTKTYPVMRCFLCHRSMRKAAALMNGYPVGPACAAGAGLLPGRSGGGSGRQPDLNLALPVLPHGAPVRDEQTIDMFGEG